MSETWSKFAESLGKTKELIKGKKFKRKLCSLSSFDSGLSNEQGEPKRCRLNGRKHASGTLKTPAIIEAEARQSELDPDHPSFIKPLVKSHVFGAFWLGLPASFCRKHMPKEDTYMTLQNENGKQYRVKYLPRSDGLSGGWRRYAISEKLSIGDVLVFHLVSATKFKVFTIRERNQTEVDHYSDQGESADMYMVNSEHKKPMDQYLFGADARTMLRPCNSENNAPEVNSRDAGRRAKVLNCSGIKGYENFSMSIDDLLKDFELPGDVKRSYYKLCCSCNTLLHSDILEGTNNTLIAAMITETVNIADGLRNCQLSTSWDKVAIWDKELDSFELLGMDVGFLRDHLHRLQKIALDPELAKCRQELSKLRSENTDAAAKIRHVHAKLSEMRADYKNRAADIKELQSKIESHELEFRELVCRAPW